MKKILISLYTTILFLTLFELPTYQKVRFTSYYPGDATGSGKCTASAICTSSFDTNENGWYTYEGKVVIAAATYACTASTRGICGKYNELPPGYKQYNLHDEIPINIDGNDYTGIVLDICGGSYWNEEFQRYDIFVDNKDHVVHSNGKVIQPGTFRTKLLLLYISVFVPLIILTKLLKKFNIIK